MLIPHPHAASLPTPPLHTLLWKKSKISSKTIWRTVSWRLLCPGNSPAQNTEVGCFSLLQGIFPTQGSNSGLPYYSRIIYQLSQQGCPRIVEWVAYPFSRGSSWCRNWTGVSYFAGGFFHSWATREDWLTHHLNLKTMKLRLWLIHHSTFKKHENWFTIWMKSKENNYPIYKLLSWNEVLPDIL